jgi:hypothetical protein
VHTQAKLHPLQVNHVSREVGRWVPLDVVL